MPRTTRGFKARRRRNKIMKAAKGFVGARRRLYRPAVATVWRSWAYAYNDRKLRKRDFRKLWITRINAASRECGVSYSQFMGWLGESDIDLNRKMLSEIASHDMTAFKQIVDAVRPA